MLSNRLYDILKYIALIALPAIEALWLTLGNIWNFPYVVEIGATIAAADVFLGSLLGISNHQWKEEGQTEMFNEDLLKDMVGYDERVEDIEESEVDA